MAQDPIVGPLREADLRDELGPHPVRGFVARDLAGKRRLLRRARLEQLRHALELVLIEPRAHVAGVDQWALLSDAVGPLLSALAGPHPRSLSRGDFAPRSGRRR